jgi:hypothetical protein
VAQVTQTQRATEGQTETESEETLMADMKMGATYGSPSYPTGNKYRGGKHDDGSIPKNMPRRKAGGMDMKHYSPAIKGGNPY